jgi:hypothetical protein
MRKREVAIELYLLASLAAIGACAGCVVGLVAALLFGFMPSVIFWPIVGILTAFTGVALGGDDQQIPPSQRYVSSPEVRYYLQLQQSKTRRKK